MSEWGGGGGGGRECVCTRVYVYSKVIKSHSTRKFTFSVSLMLDVN